MVSVATTFAASPSYVSSPIKSRTYILEYCRVECEGNLAKPRLPYRATFEKALRGDFRALETVFTNAWYHTNDSQWDAIPWHILYVIGDSRYADFVLSRPLTERSLVLTLQSEHVVGPIQEARFETFFRKHFPRTYALWSKEGLEPPPPNTPIYANRRLSYALAAESRFWVVRLYKKLETGQIIIVAPKSMSKADREDLRSLVRRQLGNDADLVFR